MTDFTAVRSHIYVSGAVIFAATHNTNETTIYAQHNAAFNAATGHFHSGSAGDAPKLLFTSLDWGDTGSQIDGTLTDHWILSKTEGSEFRIEHEVLTASRTWSLPDSDDTFAGLDTEQIFTNKSFDDTPFINRYATNENAQLGFRTSGVTKWLVGMTDDTTSDFSIYNSVESQEVLRAEATGNNKILFGPDGAHPIVFDIFLSRIYQRNDGTDAVEESVGGVEHLRQVHSSGNSIESIVSETSGSNGVIMRRYKKSSSPADNDDLYLEEWYGNDDAGNETLFAHMRVESVDVSNGTEDGKIGWATMLGGTLTTRLTLNSSSVEIGDELALPNVDPPTANLANQNGIVKAWLNYTDDSGSVADSYNVASVSDDDGDGNYLVSWDTNFSGLNGYTACATLRSAVTDRTIALFNLDTTDVEVYIYDTGSSAVADNSFLVIAIGDQ